MVSCLGISFVCLRVEGLGFRVDALVYGVQGEGVLVVDTPLVLEQSRPERWLGRASLEGRLRHFDGLRPCSA